MILNGGRVLTGARVLFAMATLWPLACDVESGSPTTAAREPNGAAIGLSDAGGDAGASEAGSAVDPLPSDSCQCEPGAMASRLPLACFCAADAGSRMCSLTLATVTPADVCHGDGMAVVRKTGCGRVSFERAGIAFEDLIPTFDEATGRLVGLFAVSDIPVLACGAWEVLYGRGLFSSLFNPSLIPAADVCPEIESCVFCGEGGLANAPGAPPPPCR